MNPVIKPRARRHPSQPPQPLFLSFALAAVGLLSAHTAQAEVSRNSATCAAPSATTCMSDSWVKACGALYNATDPNDQTSPCWSYNQSAQQAYMASSQQGAMTERLFDPSVDDFVAAMPPPSTPIPTTHTGTNATWAAQEDTARYTAAHTSISDDLTYQRMYDTTTWTNNINTCENYVYRSFYDVERWIDSMNACQGDARCVVNVSLNGMTATGPATVPGIARRQMHNADGGVIYIPGNASTRGQFLLSQGFIKQIEADPFDDNYTLGQMPKNMFYANTQAFIVPNLISAFQGRPSNVTQLQNLLNELNRGSTLYQVGSPYATGSWYMDTNGRAHQGFYDEWDFHNTMNQRTSTVTQGEAREYRRRAEALRQQFDVLTDEMKCLLANATQPGGCNASIPNALGKVQPGESQLWEGDPFAVRSIFSQVAPEAFVTPPSLQGKIGYGSQLQVGQYTVSQILSNGLSSGLDMIPPSAHLPGMVLAPVTGTTSLAASSTPVRSAVGGDPGQEPPPLISSWTPSVDPASQTSYGTLGWLINQTWAVNPPVVDSSVPYLHLNCSPRRLKIDTFTHSETVWVDTCKLTNMLLEEWGRVQDGNASCLARDSAACDWLPQDFVDRFVTKNVGYMDAVKEVEYRWCKRWTGGGQLTSSNPQVGVPDGSRGTLNSLRSYLISRQNAFEKLLKKVPVKGNDDFGTTRTDSQYIGNSTFGGGYDYTLSWHAQVKARDANGAICRMGGDALAQFSANATLFGVDGISILDTRVFASSNEADDGKAYGDAKLYVVGYQVFDTDPNHTGTHVDISAATYAKSFGDGGQKQFVTVPFQAGPITVTISAGIAYHYGGSLALSGKAPAVNSCNPTSGIYKVGATFTPNADLGVWADADASLAGIVGVGLEVELTLLGLGLPLTANVGLGADANQNATLTFDLGLDLTLTTLKGEIDLYIKALFMKLGSFTLVHWDGLSHTFPLFRTHETLPLLPLTPGSITPPTPGGDT